MFPYKQAISLRSRENYETDLTKRTNGIKGPCFLNKLSDYHPILSTNIDFMHTVCLGVVKLLFSYWFDSTREKKYCLKNKLTLLNKKLKECRPPSYVSYRPRLLEDYKIWRAHEFMHFIIYFAIPVFYEEIDDSLFQHLLLLIIALEHLLEKKIKVSELETIDLLLNKFVSQLTQFYDEHIMLSGMHELLHLVQQTRETGPLNMTSCYPFEELNRKVTRAIKG